MAAATLLWVVNPLRAVADDDDWRDSSASFICRSSNEVREIKTYVFAGSAGSAAGSGAAVRCRVDYIKGGSTLTLWTSHGSQSYCDAKAAALAAKLARGAFSCEALHAPAARVGADRPTAATRSTVVPTA